VFFVSGADCSVCPKYIYIYLFLHLVDAPFALFVRGRCFTKFCIVFSGLFLIFNWMSLNNVMI
jgi:hypothetical protein